LFVFQFCFQSGICKDSSTFTSRNANLLRARFGNLVRPSQLEKLTARIAAQESEKLTAGKREEKSKKPEVGEKAAAASGEEEEEVKEDLRDASVETVTEKAAKKNDTSKAKEDTKVELWGRTTEKKMLN
jgi:hypothetical protein